MKSGEKIQGEDLHEIPECMFGDWEWGNLHIQGASELKAIEIKPFMVQL